MDTSTEPLTNVLRAKSKQALLLWLEGFREACCLHRVVVLCFRSKKLLIRTGQCFLLNGFIFLGSIFVLKSFVLPTLLWILPDQCSQFSSQELCSGGSILKLYSFLRLGLIQLLYVFWFYPLYTFSLILSTIWYNDIAKYGFAAMGISGHTVLEPSKQNETSQNIKPERPTGLGGVVIGISEQVYSMLLLTFFFIEVYATGFIPYIGKAVNFLLLSWMYAYYCFEYKWNFSEVGLDKRLDFFESNWPFFAGFDFAVFLLEIRLKPAFIKISLKRKPMCSGYFLFLTSCELRCHGHTLSIVCSYCHRLRGGGRYFCKKKKMERCGIVEASNILRSRHSIDKGLVFLTL